MTQHAALGASSASRWMACPGSVKLSEGRADRASEHALYGSAGHALAEWCLRDGGRAPESYPEPRIEMVEIDEEMRMIVREYLAAVAAYSAGSVIRAIEQRFSLEALNPPAPMFGTADYVAFVPPSTLLVMDLKCGAGVPVSAVGNPQLRYYALGAYLALRPEIQVQVEQVRMVIVQPRAGGITEETMDTVDILMFSAKLLEAAKRTTEDGAPLKAGSHCRWCKAKGACPEQARMALASAQGAFADDALPDTNARPINPALLDNAALAEALERAEAIRNWLVSTEAEAMARLSFGAVVPGWKMVAKRAVRRWADEFKAGEALAAALPEVDLYTHSLLSPAQAEKHIPKAERGALLASLIVAESSGPTLARASDPRPEIVGEPIT